MKNWNDAQRKIELDFNEYIGWFVHWIIDFTSISTKLCVYFIPRSKEIVFIEWLILPTYQLSYLCILFHEVNK